MATGMKWIPPLPPGWEGRWDSNQRAYFFIDHTTKKTTWTDPRFHPVQPQQPASTDSDTDFSSASDSDDSQQSEADPQKVRQLQQMFPTCTHGVIVDSLKRHNNDLGQATKEISSRGYQKIDENQGNEELEALTQKLLRMYPDAKYDVVKDVVAGCNNNESMSRTTLESIGYRKAGTPSRSPNLSPARSSARSPSRSPARSPTRSPEPAKPKVSEADKKRILAKLEREFPKQPKNVISMGFEVCEFDEEKTRELMKAWDDQETTDTRSGSRAASSSRATSASTTSGHASVEPAALTTTIEPVTMDDTPSSSSRGGSANKKKQHKSPQKKKTKDEGKPRHKPKNTARTKTTSHGAAAREVTQRQQEPTSRAVTSQPHSVSEYRTVPLGPNPLHRSGPDKDILIPKYENAMGPNKEYRHGPDRANVCGPQGAVGVDPSLRCGPQSLVENNQHLRQPIESFL